VRRATLVGFARDSSYILRAVRRRSAREETTMQGAVDATAAATTGADARLQKPALSLLAISNLSFGFFGIQIAFALQTANVSRIFQTLGAAIEDLPILWIAGPVTGLLVQPIVGWFSDRTWSRFGRRRPYFLGGALASAVALLVLPNAPVLWLAVAAFWLLDIAINVTMEPFRAFVGDMLPARQRTKGYAVQTIFIGTGALLASAAPWLLTNAFGVAGDAPAGVVPEAVKLAFFIGAAALFVAVGWTVVSTREYPPEALARYAAAEGRVDAPVDHAPAGGFIRSLVADVVRMPRAMRGLALVQFCSWSGLFVMWVYSTPVVAHRYFDAAPNTPGFNAAGDWVGVMFSVYNAVAAAYAFVLPKLVARFGGERVHATNLAIGALGLASYCLFTHPNALLASMVAVGIAWASILTIPYALLCEAIPYSKFGTYMGIFNFFIVLPQIAVAAFAGPLVKAAFPVDPSGIMWIGGGALALGAVLAWRKVSR
jgi:maltose/moltooligosaccharide transporter